MKEKLQPIWKKAQVVWKNYGYYISLVCLLSLFGLAAWLYRTGNHDADAVYAASAAQPVLAQETAAVSPAPTVEPESSWRKPVQGELTAAYSPDELQWNETLSQWRTHGGVDFSADTGSVVMAAADGVISAAYKDDLMGYTVEITHSGGWVSRYACLGTLEMADPGETVKQGATIGSVGTSALAEAADGPHLHFELLKDGRPQAPEFTD